MPRPLEPFPYAPAPQQLRGGVVVGGIDPGPRPGLVLLRIVDGQLLTLERGPQLTWQRVVEESTHVQVERYVRGRASVRSANAGAQQETAALAQAACAAVTAAGKVLQALPAGSVKPWATDERLKSYVVAEHAETVYAATKGGGGHDRDAARHALFLAVRLRLLPPR